MSSRSFALRRSKLHTYVYRAEAKKKCTGEDRCVFLFGVLVLFYLSYRSKRHRMQIKGFSPEEITC